MKLIVSIKQISILFTVATCVFMGCHPGKNYQSKDITTVRINTIDNAPDIDPMIYGQMLEFCNDRIIYDGVVNKDGSERPHVDNLLKHLNIPVVRWPAGTYIFEFDWRNSIGPVNTRPVTPNKAWGGENNNRFGTDEFIAWCRKINTEPYFNLNMGNLPGTRGTLQEALNWIEYVNGSTETTFGKERELNGNKEQYGVKYWGIGNENYGGWGQSKKETAEEYSDKLAHWSKTIKARFPQLSLLGVGHTSSWNKTVLEQNSGFIDFLTQHYYVTSKYKDNKIEAPENSLFAPAKIEAHIQKLRKSLDSSNLKSGRQNNPIRFSIDEWNNRHSVLLDGKFKFTRQDLRRQTDVAIVAQTLNVFIRQSPAVGMANYIFPVNAHGLIRTIGDTGAYKSSIFYVFDQYRNQMTGKKINVHVQGPGVSAGSLNINLEGDASEIQFNEGQIPFIDAAAVLNKNGRVYISLVNRSPEESKEVKLLLPAHFKAVTKWSVTSTDINTANTPESRQNIIPEVSNINHIEDNLKLSLEPCGLYIIECIRK